MFSHFKSITIGSKNHKNVRIMLKFGQPEHLYANFQKIILIFDFPDIRLGGQLYVSEAVA